MSGGLKVGDLYVLLSAKTSAFGQSMESAAKLTEQIAKRVKRAAGEIGRAGAAIGAGIAATLAVAAQHNASVAKEVQNAKDVFNTFANEIASAMLPSLRAMNQHLRELLGWWQSLSPEAKAHIAHWIEIATVVGVAALALSKAAGIVAALAPIFEVFGAALSVGLAPILAIIVGIVVLATAVAMLHKAWRENWGGIQEKTRSVVEALSGYWQSFKEWMSNNFFNWFIDQWADIEKAIAHAGNFLAHPIDSKARANANNDSDSMINNWSIRMKDGAVGDSLKLAAEEVKTGAEVVVNEWKLMITQAADWVKKTMGFTGQQGHVTSAAAATHVVAARRLGESGEQGMMEEFYKNADVKSLTRSNSFGEVAKLGDDGEQGHMTADLAQEYQEEIKWRVLFNEQLGQLGQALTAGISSFASKLGELGTVINAGIQGFKNGGIWGALIAVFVELFSKFKRFQELLDIGGGQIQMALNDLMQGFNSLVDGLRPLMGAIESIAHAVHGVLNPIFMLIGKVLGALAPIFESIGISMQVMNPIINMVCDLIGAILVPILQLLNPILKVVAETFLATELALQYVELGLNMFVDWIDKLFGSNNEGGVAKSKADIAATLKQMDDLWNKGLDGVANESANTAESLGKLGATADSVSEQLMNVPQGFKVALSQFNATNATSSSGSGSSSSSQAANERKNFRNTGNPSGANPNRAKANKDA